MKKAIFIFSLLIISLSCKSQDDIISLNDITINGMTILNESDSYIIQHFGQPLNIETYLFEMDNVEGELYIYFGITFYVINNKVELFEITNDNFVVTLNNFKIGDNISSLENHFPLSYSNRNTKSVTLNLNDYDGALAFIFNQNNLITKIGLYSY